MIKNKTRTIGLSTRLLLLSTSFLVIASIVISALVNMQVKKQALADGRLFSSRTLRMRE